MSTSTNKHVLDTAQEGFSRWNVTFQSACLHEQLEVMVIDDLEWLLVLCNPADELNADNFVSGLYSIIVCWVLRFIVPPTWCVHADCK
jgi:hypothetical protein